jgi:hypothetical protein
MLTLGSSISVSIVVGSAGKAGSIDGAISSARLSAPQGVCSSITAGVCFIADTGNNLIRVWDGTTLRTIAGSTTSGFANGSGSAARFSSPSGILAMNNDFLFVCDTGNNRIRSIRYSPASTSFDGRNQIPVLGLVTTIAGTGAQGTINGSSASFTGPIGIAGNTLTLQSTVSTNNPGTLYIADAGNHSIRSLTQIACSATTSV